MFKALYSWQGELYLIKTLVKWLSLSAQTVFIWKDL